MIMISHCIRLNSLSSGLMLGVTLFRNQNSFSAKLIAQGGYAVTALIAHIESLAALCFLALSIPLCLYSNKPFERAFVWVESSLFCLTWAVVDFILNPFVDPLIADEKNAFQIAKEGNFFKIPRGAIY
jgi:hypothetical protein